MYTRTHYAHTHMHTHNTHNTYMHTTHIQQTHAHMHTLTMHTHTCTLLTKGSCIPWKRMQPQRRNQMKVWCLCYCLCYCPPIKTQQPTLPTLHVMCWCVTSSTHCYADPSVAVIQLLLFVWHNFSEDTRKSLLQQCARTLVNIADERQ